MDASLEYEIIALEKELLDPAVRKSGIDRVNELLADDSFEIGQSGRTYRKADMLNALPMQEAAEFAASRFQLRSLSEDVVLLTYFVERVDLGSRMKSSSWRSSIWTLTNGQWQMLFHQGTAAAPE